MALIPGTLRTRWLGIPGQAARGRGGIRFSHEALRLLDDSLGESHGCGGRPCPAQVVELTGLPGKWSGREAWWLRTESEEGLTGRVTSVGRRVLWRYGFPLFRDLIAPNKSHRDRSETMLVIWQRWSAWYRRQLGARTVISCLVDHHMVGETAPNPQSAIDKRTGHKTPPSRARGASPAAHAERQELGATAKETTATP